MIEPLRIFVVEDDAVILMQLEMLLEDADHTVVGSALSAAEAIPRIRALRPELLLLDLHLRDGSSGYDVARAVRDQEDLTIVFITANARKLTSDMAGAAAVIAKPFSEKTLQGSLAFLEECVHRPPPMLALPFGLSLAPAFTARLEGLRGAV